MGEMYDALCHFLEKNQVKHMIKKKINSWRSTFLLSFEGNKFAASRGWLKRSDFRSATASHTRKTQIYPLLWQC